MCLGGVRTRLMRLRVPVVLFVNASNRFSSPTICSDQLAQQQPAFIHEVLMRYSSEHSHMYPPNNPIPKKKSVTKILDDLEAKRTRQGAVAEAEYE